MGTAVVPTSQGSTIADVGDEAEVGVAQCGIARRRWSEAQRRRIVAESYRSGESASAVARRHGVHTSVLFRWRRRYRTLADSGAGFVPVVVEAPEPASEAASGRMEIVLGDDVRVIVDATVHAGALARVVAVVAGR